MLIVLIILTMLVVFNILLILALKRLLDGNQLINANKRNKWTEDVDEYECLLLLDTDYDDDLVWLMVYD